MENLKKQGRLPAQHVFLKQITADFARKNAAFRKVYYYRMENPECACFAMECTGPENDVLFAIRNLRTALSGIDAGDFKLYDADRSRNGQYVKAHGELIYDELVDQMRSRKRKRAGKEEAEWNTEDDS